MKAEYKRDLSGNYLVLYEEEEPDTSSYQMRMLVKYHSVRFKVQGAGRGRTVYGLLRHYFETVCTFVI